MLIFKTLTYNILKTCNKSMPSMIKVYCVSLCRPVVLSIEDGKTYRADFVLATLLDSCSSRHHSHSSTTQNQTNQSNGFDTHHTSVSHNIDSNTTMDNTLADTRPPSTSRAARKTQATIRPLRSVNSDVDFPSGSQFNPPAHTHSTPSQPPAGTV